MAVFTKSVRLFPLVVPGPTHSISAKIVGTVPMTFVTPQGHSGLFPCTGSSCATVAQNCGPWHRLGVTSLVVTALPPALALPVCSDVGLDGDNGAISVHWKFVPGSFCGQTAT